VTERNIAGVAVHTIGADLLAARSRAVETAVVDGVPAALVAKDSSLWGPAAAPEASIRLGWLDLPRQSRELLPRLATLREEIAADGLDHVVLAGMGGSSLAPEVITRTAGVELTVLDTTDPHQVRRALTDRLDRTVVVVSSKSGGTTETDSHRRVYEQAFRDAGLDDAQIARRIIVVTDPGSPLEESATEAGYRVVLADPSVGGRFSALTAFGLVPSALAGVDVESLLDDAAALEPALSGPSDNPGLELGGALGGGALEGRDKLVLADAGSGILGFGDWAEQLVAESTGKEGKGLLPVVVEGIDAPGFIDAGPDAHRVVLGEAPEPYEGTAVQGPLGAQFLLWEYATAVAGRTLGINPFDQPNVQEAKDLTKKLLEQAGDGPLDEGSPAFTDGAVDVHASPEVLGGATTLPEVLDALRAAVPDRGYLAVLAFLDRQGDAPAAGLRPGLARRLAGRPVTFGWGPRYLHSTGQFHKGGPPVGAFLMLTGAVTDDLAVPGKPYTFGKLQMAQALGDLNALTSRGRPAVRLHLRDRTAGLRQVLDAVGAGR
jgi:glucose-6-phosphate isomerase